MNRREFALACGVALLATSTTAHADTPAQPAILDAARAVWRRSVVIDANLAPPVATLTFPQPPEVLTVARAAGVTAVKTTMGGFDGSFADTVEEIAFFQRLIEAHPQVFAAIRSANDIRAAKRAGKVGVIFSFESVTALEGKVERIDMFRNMGVRVMQLSYNLPSPFGAGVLSPPDSGLTDLGRQAVEKLNTAGVALDLSHANPATTMAAVAASKKPVLITHAGCAAVHANPRNKTDEILRAVAQSGGVVGIFDLFYLAPAGRQPNLDDYLAHMTHALNVCGEDHVGIGSDTSFDAYTISPEEQAAWDAETKRRQAAGVAAPEEDGRLPYTEGLNRPDRTLVIADGLMRRGYKAATVEKVLGGNFLRAFGEIW